MVEGQKNPEFGRSKDQISPARIVNEAGSLKSPGSLKSGIGEGWGMFFCKAASKGLPRPFNAAGWRCSNRNTKQILKLATTERGSESEKETPQGEFSCRPYAHCILV